MNRSGIAITVILAMTWFMLVAAPARPAEPKRDHEITVDDYFTQADIFEAVIAPDGKTVAYTEGRWQQSTDDRKADIWLVDTTTGRASRLTFDRRSGHSLKWSPDGQWLYFAGSRTHDGEKRPPLDGSQQVWRISRKGGEPLAVTRVEGGIGLFDLAADGRSVVYTTDTDVADEEWKDLRGQFAGIQYSPGNRKRSRIWQLDLQSWRSAKLAEPERMVRDMALAPDGRRLALITTPDDTVVTFEGRSRIDILEVANGTSTTVPDKVFRAQAPSPYGWLERLAWSANGNALAFTVIFDGYPAEMIVADWSDKDPHVFKLQRPQGVSLRGYGSPLQWRGSSGDLCFLGEEKARVRLYCAPDVGADRQVPVRDLTPGDVVVASFHISPSGEQTALLLNDTTNLPDIFLLEKSSPPRRLTHVNPQVDTWKLPQLSTVSWKGAGVDNVEGVLELPPDYRPGQKLPLIVQLHGGPTTANYFQLEYWIYGRTLLPAKGYALLSPNYRGSTGYGDQFLTDLVGRENDIEVEDILKGVDALVERGIADPDRLGVMGWSNGGYLTNCLISRTTRFKAASSGAGIVDTVIEWGTNDEPAYAIALKKGFPWNRPDVYRKTSPTYRLDRIRTPTLIHVGGNDERCPPWHSRMLYRALKEYVHVPTELLVYPGEPHGLMKYKHRKAKMAWDMAWFERYLKPDKQSAGPAK